MDPKVLTDGDLVKFTLLPVAPAGQASWIQYEFSKPQTIQAITLAMAGMRVIFRSQRAHPASRPGVK